MKKNIEKREYNFTDAELMQRIDGLILLLNRDATELATYGVTPVEITKLSQDNEAFKAMKSDMLLKAERMTSTLQKVMAADELRVMIRTLKVRVNSISATYPNLLNEFTIAGIDKVRNDELYRNGRNIGIKLVQYMDQLAVTGVDQAFVDRFNACLETFDHTLDSQFQSEYNRNIGTDSRRAAGNSLYNRMVNWCRFGKDYWYTRNEAKYNDYIIYDTPVTHYGKMSGNVSDVVTGKPVVRAILELAGTDHLVETDAAGNYVFENLPVGKYILTVSAEGYEEFTKAEIIVTKNATTVENVILVAVAE